MIKAIREIARWLAAPRSRAWHRRSCGQSYWSRFRLRAPESDRHFGHPGFNAGRRSGGL